MSEYWLAVYAVTAALVGGTIQYARGELPLNLPGQGGLSERSGLPGLSGRPHAAATPAPTRYGGAPLRSLSSARRIEGINIQGWHQRAVRNRRTINRQRLTIRWLRSIVAKHQPPRTLSSAGSVSYWAQKQIAAAETLGRESGGDPWPNCPDPYDGGGASWYDTVACENGGNWLDSPGYYRCGLQFDPMWERRFGRLCP